MKNNLKLEFLVGLPGSGKTSYANKYLTDKKYQVISLDSYKDNFNYRGRTQLEVLKRVLSETSFARKEILVVDGLFLTNKDILEAIKVIAPYFDMIDVEIHYWKEDRETCLKNDGGRREVSSARTIETAVFENIDVEYLNNELIDWDTQIKNIVYHDVVLKPDWYVYFKPHTESVRGGILRSAKWCSGGSWGDCWGGFGSVTSEKPAEFSQLDNILEQVCPTVSFLHYKKILKECVYTEESSESDYYGGCSHYINWACNLEKLYETLKELGDIE